MTPPQIDLTPARHFTNAGPASPDGEVRLRIFQKNAEKISHVEAWINETEVHRRQDELCIPFEDGREDPVASSIKPWRFPNDPYRGPPSAAAPAIRVDTWGDDVFDSDGIDWEEQGFDPGRIQDFAEAIKYYQWRDVRDRRASHDHQVQYVRLTRGEEAALRLRDLLEQGLEEEERQRVRTDEETKLELRREYERQAAERLGVQIENQERMDAIRERMQARESRVIREWRAEMVAKQKEKERLKAEQEEAERLEKKKKEEEEAKRKLWEEQAPQRAREERERKIAEMKEGLDKLTPRQRENRLDDIRRAERVNREENWKEECRQKANEMNSDEALMKLIRAKTASLSGAGINTASSRFSTPRSIPTSGYRDPRKPYTPGGRPRYIYVRPPDVKFDEDVAREEEEKARRHERYFVSMIEVPEKDA